MFCCSALRICLMCLFFVSWSASSLAKYILHFGCFGRPKDVTLFFLFFNEVPPIPLSEIDFQSVSRRAHLGHCVLAVLADSCSSLEYERMRVAYNSIIDSKMPAAPPLEEWQGMNDICDAIFCRCAQV